MGQFNYIQNFKQSGQNCLVYVPDKKEQIDYQLARQYNTYSLPIIHADIDGNALVYQLANKTSLLSYMRATTLQNTEAAKYLYEILTFYKAIANKELKLSGGYVMPTLDFIFRNANSKLEFIITPTRSLPIHTTLNQVFVEFAENFKPTDKRSSDFRQQLALIASVEENDVLIKVQKIIEDFGLEVGAFTQKAEAKQPTQPAKPAQQPQAVPSQQPQVVAAQLSMINQMSMLPEGYQEINNSQVIQEEPSKMHSNTNKKRFSDSNALEWSAKTEFVVEDNDNETIANVYQNEAAHKGVNFILKETGAYEFIPVANEPYIIGYDSTPGSILNRRVISGKHIQMWVLPDRVQLMDLNSSNGTRINNQRIKPMTKLDIADGTEITLANVKYIIEVV